MDKRIEKILQIWHKYFKDEDKRYSKFEDSDIEYFVGCMLYNHFAFSKALDTMKTMDLSYDFLSVCGNEYNEVKNIIDSINFENELDKLKFLQDYIVKAKEKYTNPELYLLNRLDKHIESMAYRYEKNVEIQKVDFQNPLTR